MGKIDKLKEIYNQAVEKFANFWAAEEEAELQSKINLDRAIKEADQKKIDEIKNKINKI